MSPIPTTLYPFPYAHSTLSHLSPPPEKVPSPGLLPDYHFGVAIPKMCGSRSDVEARTMRETDAEMGELT